MGLPEAKKRIQGILDCLDKKDTGSVHIESTEDTNSTSGSSASNNTKKSSKSSKSRSSKSTRRKKKEYKLPSISEIEIMALQEENKKVEREKKILMEAILGGEKAHKAKLMAESMTQGGLKPFMTNEAFKIQERKFYVSHIPKLKCNNTNIHGYDKWWKYLSAVATGFGIGYLTREEVI